MKTPKWYKTRKYKHFDRPVTSAKASSIVTNSQKVSQHAFFPFIKSEIKVPRYKKEKNEVEIKSRPIAYASHLDSHIFAYYSYIINLKYEAVLKKEDIGNCITAYRRFPERKCNIDFAHEAFRFITDNKNCIAITMDVKGFFDHLDHILLKQKWCALLNKKLLPDDHYAVYKAITRWSCVKRDILTNMFSNAFIKPNIDRICTAKEFREKIRKNKYIEKNNECMGIPQGSPISAVLSNIYMLDFDRKLSYCILKRNGLYRRYSDDILVVLPILKNNDIKYTERIGNSIKRYIKNLLRHNKLDISEEKTMISVFRNAGTSQSSADKRLQYLGFLFDGNGISIRSHTISRFMRKMKQIVNCLKRKAIEKNIEKGYRKTIYERCSHLGKKNYINYVKRAFAKMRSQIIKKQMKKHWRILQKLLSEP